MIKNRKILILITFIVTLLFCTGINVYLNVNHNLYFTEISADTDNIENYTNLKDFSFDDLTLNQIKKSLTPLVLKNHLFKEQKNILFNNFCFTIWQPPKIS